MDEDLCRRPSSGATTIVTLLFAGASSSVAAVLLSRESQIPLFMLYRFSILIKNELFFHFDMLVSNRTPLLQESAGDIVTE